MASRYTVGIDFGTESGRAVLVDVATGRELATAVYEYSNGVIDVVLPAPYGEVRLGPDWALQDPLDYIRTVQITVPAVLKASGVEPASVVGLGIDFTACTMLPTTAEGRPLATVAEFAAEPHAWVKLWKHHAAQPEADLINAVARKRGEAVAAALRWQDLFGVVLLEEPPDPRGGAARLCRRGSTDRGDRLGRSGSSPASRRATAARRATRRSGPRPRASPAATTSARSIRASPTWSTRR